MIRDQQAQAVMRAALAHTSRVCNVLERGMARWSWKYWQLPPRVRRKQRLVRIAIRRGLDGAAYEVIAQRWFLLSRTLLIIGPWFFISGAAGFRIVGTGVVAIAVACMVVGTQRRFKSRRCVSPGS